MKNLPLLLLLVLAFGATIQSCSDSKTYAERLEDERNAINRFTSKHNIIPVSQADFERDTITGENEYVQFSNGVWLHIIKRGEGDSIQARDEVILRMAEYNVMAEVDNEVYADSLTNVDSDRLVDSFVYRPDTNPTYFEFEIKNGFVMNGFFPYEYARAGLLSTYSVLDVPNGLIYVLPYLRDGAQFKIIIPSKLGHDISLRSVHPYFYHVHKLQLR